jgi:hypothetical protein
MQGMAADKTIVLQMTPAMDKQVMSLPPNRAARIRLYLSW